MNTFTDDLLLMQEEEYQYRCDELQRMMAQFIDAYGRKEAVVVAGMLRKAAMEKVVTNNPVKTIKDAYGAMKMPTQEVAF